MAFWPVPPRRSAQLCTGKTLTTLGANPHLNRTIACSPSIHVTAAADAHDKSNSGKCHQDRRAAIAQEGERYSCCRHKSNHHSDIHDQVEKENSHDTHRDE